MDNRQKAKEFIQNRKLAYAQVFNDENEFLKTVMEDLERFCRANVSTFHRDSRIHAVLEGRREVYLRIKEHLELSLEELISKTLGEDQYE